MPSNQPVSPLRAFPTLAGLFHGHSQSLASSFSLFSIFKSSAPSLPNSALLDPLLSLATDTPPLHQPTNRALFTIKALVGLQTYAQRVQIHLTHHYVQGQDPGEVELDRLSDLMTAYLHAVPIIAALVWDAEGAESIWGKKQDELDLHQALTQSLRAVFALRSIILSSSTPKTTSALALIHRNLLGSIFSPPPTVSYLLPPIFERARHLISEMQSSSRQLSATSRAIIVNVSDDSALEAFSLLNTFAASMGGVESLSGPKLARTKAQKEADLCRPLRIRIEAMLVLTDLALSMATVHIKDVKLRAGSPGEDEDEAEPPGVRWEIHAEEGLLDCFILARTLLDERRGAVLVDHVDIAVWLGEHEVPSKATSKGSSSPASPSEGISPAAEEDDDTEASDSDSETSLSSTEEEEEEVAHPCPLRMLFGLHDRFEEQRLAVWLGLPTARRGGMWTFMRGGNGKLGEEWDALGLALMLEYDSETLMRHGLSADKLDKWVELASTRNAKKIRKRAKRA